MYHSISKHQHDPHAISPTEFKHQMRLLLDSHVVSLEEGLVLLRDKRSLKNTWVITFDDALLDFYTIALPILREFGYPATMFIPTGLVGKNSVWDSYDKTKPLMTWAQLEECQKWNVTFGSHTVNHARLNECADETLMDELQRSLQILQSRLQHITPALAYPGGYHDVRVRLAARAAGYDCALVASSRWGNGPESDLFQLRREGFNR
jgi:peptidoglycan/xylan/chitin deacetylase (PgdA/CDA1 family)